MVAKGVSLGRELPRLAQQVQTIVDGDAEAVRLAVAVCATRALQAEGRGSPWCDLLRSLRSSILGAISLCDKVMICLMLSCNMTDTRVFLGFMFLFSFFL